MLRLVRRIRHLWGALALAVGAFSSTALPIAHGLAERESATAQAHVEQTGSKSCPQVHSDSACQVCRVLRLVGKRPDPVVLVETTGCVRASPEVWVEHRAVTALVPSASPRAPPIA